ncbi:MAG: hypothetical protein DLM66_13335 [Candidatus Dormiibacter spiritus]|nr:MAG: hypothetical protein DLM66_13335 [Candidatus Dormibacteraeota bacterium]
MRPPRGISAMIPAITTGPQISTLSRKLTLMTPAPKVVGCALGLGLGRATPASQRLTAALPASAARSPAPALPAAPAPLSAGKAGAPPAGRR